MLFSVIDSLGFHDFSNANGNNLAERVMDERAFKKMLNAYADFLHYLRLVADKHMKIGQVSIVLAIIANEGITQHELSEELNIKQQTVSKGCRTLEKAGIIIRRRPSDIYQRVACHLDLKGKAIKRRLVKNLGDVI